MRFVFPSDAKVPGDASPPIDCSPRDLFEMVQRFRHKLGHDVPHAGGVIPNRIITGRYFDSKDIVPHLFEETRCNNTRIY